MVIKHTQTASLHQSRRKIKLNWPLHLPSCQIVFNGSENAFDLVWKDASSGVDLRCGSIMIVANGTGDDVKLELRRGVFPPSASGSLRIATVSDGAKWKSASLTITAELEPESSFAREGSVAAPLVAASLLSRIASDVCFYFPRNGRRLWSNESILRHTSPYLDSLLSSGFAETAQSSESSTPATSPPEIKPYTFEDSDEELEDTIDRPHSSEGGGGTPSYKTITITEATFTTYFAVLAWISTRHIEFEALRSLRDLPEAYQEESADIVSRSKATKTTSPYPVPVSPKSVYRLAHLLEMHELASLALANYASQLDFTNIASELYSDVASSYSAIRDVALTYAVDHWPDIIETDAFVKLEARGEAGDLDGLTGLLLSKRLVQSQLCR